MKIRRKVTIQVDRLKITIPNRPENPSWCEICESTAEFLDAGDAAKLVSALVAQGIAIVEGDLHFFHPPHSGPMICLNSIIREPS